MGGSGLTPPPVRCYCTEVAAVCDRRSRTVKTRKPAGIYKPFELLPELLKGRPIRLEVVALPPPPSPRPPAAPPPLSDAEAFDREMEGVRPVDWNRPADAPPTPPPAAPATGTEDAAMSALKSLVDCGAGFIVADTPEYMEGVGPHAPPGITRRLHRGDFAIQGHLDLHGLAVPEARETFDAFVNHSISQGHRTVLIIHGRGLSSPADPVLKSKVREWLSCGPWRKWVIAFTSARMCDGGAGASYVLLRQRPLARRWRRRHRRPRGA